MSSAEFDALLDQILRECDSKITALDKEKQDLEKKLKIAEDLNEKKCFDELIQDKNDELTAANNKIYLLNEKIKELEEEKACNISILNEYKKINLKNLNDTIMISRKVENLEKENECLIEKYNKQISELEKEKSKLLIDLDSLKKENKDLKINLEYLEENSVLNNNIFNKTKFLQYITEKIRESKMEDIYLCYNDNGNNIYLINSAGQAIKLENVRTGCNNPIPFLKESDFLITNAKNKQIKEVLYGFDVDQISIVHVLEEKRIYFVVDSKECFYKKEIDPKNEMNSIFKVTVTYNYRYLFNDDNSLFDYKELDYEFK